MASKASKGGRRLKLKFATKESWDNFCNNLLKHGIVPPTNNQEWHWDKHKQEMWDLVEWEMKEKAKKYGLYLPPIGSWDREVLKARDLVEEEIARRESEEKAQSSTSERVERSK